MAIRALVGLCSFIAACSSNPTPAPRPAPALPTQESLVGKAVTVWCLDCEAAGMLINLWDTPQSAGDGAKLQAQVPHGTRCKVADAGTSKKDGRLWYVVDCGDLNIGWILSDLTK